MPNRVFFPQAALDEWIVSGAVELQGDELTIMSEGRTYRVAEAVRVLGEVSGTADAHEVVGKVRSRRFFEELGAELVETSMILGDNAYDIVPGWLGVPVGPFQQHASPRHPTADNPAATDEDLLARFLERTL